jgi:hypothetical protein
VRTGASRFGLMGWTSRPGDCRGEQCRPYIYKVGRRNGLTARKCFVENHVYRNSGGERQLLRAGQLCDSQRSAVLGNCREFAVAVYPQRDCG